jgi:hypothetical protein
MISLLVEIQEQVLECRRLAASPSVDLVTARKLRELADQIEARELDRQP